MFDHLGQLFTDPPREAALAVVLGVVLQAVVLVRHFHPQRYPQSYLLPGSTAAVVLVFVGLDLNRVAHTAPRFVTNSDGSVSALWAYPRAMTLVVAVVATFWFGWLVVKAIFLSKHLVTFFSCLAGTLAMSAITSCVLQYAMRDDAKVWKKLSNFNEFSWFMLIICLSGLLAAVASWLIFWLPDHCRRRRSAPES